jgi:hypothetical protein
MTQHRFGIRTKFVRLNLRRRSMRKPTCIKAAIAMPKNNAAHIEFCIQKNWNIVSLPSILLV